MSVLDEAVSRVLQQRDDGEEALALWQQIWSRASSGGRASVQAYLQSLVERALHEDAQGGCEADVCADYEREPAEVA